MRPMSKYTFKQFQAEYPDDDACLEAIMKVQYGGTQIACPGCGADSKFTKIARMPANGADTTSIRAPGRSSISHRPS